MLTVNVSVAENDVVDAFIHAVLSLLTQFIERTAESAFAFLYVKEDRELCGVESLVTDVAENVELGIGQYRLWQAHHLAV